MKKKFLVLGAIIIVITLVLMILVQSISFFNPCAEIGEQLTGSSKTLGEESGTLCIIFNVIEVILFVGFLLGILGIIIGIFRKSNNENKNN